MVNSSSSEIYQETSIFTQVKVGKSYKSKGWALPRKDIYKIIPIEKYEGNCHIKIDGITALAKLRINPRLFYRSNDLSIHLKKLYEEESNSKVPLEIKLKETQLYSNFISKYLTSKPLKSLNIELPVGKSFSSKAWRINNEFTSKFIPLNEYFGVYDIIVDDIPSSAILDIQTRIFYKDDKLSDYLKKLHDLDEEQKVSAEIIFDEDLVLFELKTNIKEVIDHSIEDDSVSNLESMTVISKGGKAMTNNKDVEKCPICGKKIPKNIKNEFTKTSEKYGIKCSYCLQRIYALENFNLFKEKSFSNFVMKDYMRKRLNLEDYDFVWDLLLKFEMLEQVGNSFKLIGNYDIEEVYGPILKNNEDTHKIVKPRLVLGGESEEPINDVQTCIVCGKELKDDEYEKCSACFSKEFALKEINQILPYFSVDGRISEEEIPEEKLPKVKTKMIFSKLIDTNLIHQNSDKSFSLNFDNLINLMVENGVAKNNIIFDSLNNNLNIIFIPNYVFSDEELLDSYINWEDFKDYVVFHKSFSSVRVNLRNRKKNISNETANDCLAAKILAIIHLKNLGVIKLLNREEIEKLGISKP